MSGIRITINRQQMFPTPGRAYRTAWKWSYSYTVTGNLPGEPMPCQYGPGITALRNTLKRNFPDAEIVQSWDGKIIRRGK